MNRGDLELRLAWEQHVGATAADRAVLDGVVRRHREAGRHYHDVRHLIWVVRHAIDLGGRLPVDDLGAIVAAAAFHDAVHDVRAADNEAASARLAVRRLTELGWPADRCDRVARMIAATAGHDVESADLDTKVLLAADLAVLAADPNRYGDYVRAVRREYAHLEEAEWRAGRAAVLRALADRPRLFAPELGLDDWERRARANIAAELAGLDGR